jgi:sirohydrochlorin cobaltochelatase
MEAMNDSLGKNGAAEQELAALEAKINELLPPRYVGCFEEVSPASMGSAALRYDSQGRVVWGEIWTTFCHLALAGGPPHRGRLLGPVTLEEVRSSPESYAAVVAELERALGLCVDLPVSPQRQPGWIGLECDAAATASWLVRAIVAENVIARHEDATLFVPAGPNFRVEKEIKNVVVCAAKTCHYLFDHLEPEQQPTGASRPLIGPPLPDEIVAAPDRYAEAAAHLQQSIRQSTGLPILLDEAPGWIGIPCESEEAAVWMLRAIAVEDMLVRRTDTTLYVPVDIRTATEDPIAKTATVVAHAQRLWKLRSRKSNG